MQYERERIAAAEQPGGRTSALDISVRAARSTGKKAQGRAFELPPNEPWPSPVNGVELLDESEAMGRYVVMSSESKGMLALWATHGRAHRIARSASRNEPDSS
jgi:hypothetical protein